jgi:hypothetical protein
MFGRVVWYWWDGNKAEWWEFGENFPDSSVVILIPISPRKTHMLTVSWIGLAAGAVPELVPADVALVVPGDALLTPGPCAGTDAGDAGKDAPASLLLVSK